MRDNHYEASDYTILNELYLKGAKLLKSHHSEAFHYILHNFYSVLSRFNPRISEKLVIAIKQYECSGDYDKALKKYQELMDEYFQNVIVDINEHHGF